MAGLVAFEAVFIGLGANLGAAEQTLRDAVQAIGDLPGTRLVARSSFYASAPLDAQGPDFINAAVQVETSLEPVELLRALHGIEDAMGRERPYRNAPRTLDLDLLLYGQRQIQTAELTLPHPRLHLRAFVLRPLLELAPGIEHPALGRLADCLTSTSDQTIRKLT